MTPVLGDKVDVAPTSDELKGGPDPEHQSVPLETMFFTSQRNHQGAHPEVDQQELLTLLSASEGDLKGISWLPSLLLMGSL